MHSRQFAGTETHRRLRLLAVLAMRQSGAVLRVKPAGKEVDGVRNPATVGPAEESRVELEVGGVGLGSAELVGTLIDDPRAVHRQEVNAGPHAGDSGRWETGSGFARPCG